MAVTLVKGQKISLAKEAGGKLTHIMMGLGWNGRLIPMKVGGFLGFGGKAEMRPAEIDLDASCLMFNGEKGVVDVVYFNQLRSQEGSVVHSGDNRTGESDGDAEQIVVDLSKVPPQVQSLIFVVNSFSGETFNQIENAFCRVVDKQNGRELARYDLSCQGSHTGQVMARVYRHDGEWKMHAIGENVQGKTFKDMMPSILPHA